MSVIVKGMQMPEECETCPMHLFYTNTGRTVCILTHATLAEHYDTGIAFDRYENCPLIELPEEHGRLIDADALGDKMRGKWTVYDYQALGTMPIIVEAEGKDEN